MFVVIYRGSIIPGFLTWCRNSSIHSIKTKTEHLIAQRVRKPLQAMCDKELSVNKLGTQVAWVFALPLHSCARSPFSSSGFGLFCCMFATMVWSQPQRAPTRSQPLGGVCCAHAQIENASCLGAKPSGLSTSLLRSSGSVCIKSAWERLIYEDEPVVRKLASHKFADPTTWP